jgi:hypothetical protein
MAFRKLRAAKLSMLGLACVGTVAAIAWWRHSRVEHPVATGSSWDLRWTPGLEYTFAFSWTSKAQASIAKAAHVDVSADLAGHLVAVPMADSQGTTLVLRLRDLSRHDLRAMGQGVVDSDDAVRSQLEAPTAWATVGPHGQIDRLRFAPDAPRLFRETVTEVVEQAQVAAGDGTSDWTTTEPGPNGMATAAYHADGLQGTRKRIAYTTLNALGGSACADCRQDLRDAAQIVIDPRGAVASLDDTESLHVVQAGQETLVASNHYTLRLESIGQQSVASASVPPTTVDVTLGTPGTLTDADRQAVLEHEAEGFTQTALEAAIDAFSRTGQSPGDKTWLIHARAYLLLHPEALESLGHKLADANATPRGRNMVMQVLAVVGNPRAQEIMLTALDGTRGLESDRSYGLLMQKLGVIEHPTQATVAYVEAAYRDAHGRNDEAALNDAAALGGVASKLARSGDTVEAHRIVSRLEGDLRSARSSEEKRGLILALRNAGAAGDSDVRAFAKDPNSNVREEVARSLGDVQTADSRAVLDSLAMDADPVVATNALQSLDHAQATSLDVHAIAVDVLSGQTPIALDGTFADFFAGHTNPPDDARAVYAFLLARTKNPELARRIRFLMEQLSS